jgi:hypothetical protein
MASAIALALALTVAGCGPILPAAPSPAPTANGEEHLPAAASIWLTGEPQVAVHGFAVDLRSPDAPGFRQTEAFSDGTIIRAVFSVAAGSYLVRTIDDRCTIALTLAPLRESDVVIRTAPDGSCVFALAREHDAGIEHVASGTLDVHVLAPPGGHLEVLVRSTDTPANPDPHAVPPDEGHLAIVGPIWPGSYDVILTRDGVVLEETTITIRDVGPAGDLVELWLDGIPGTAPEPSGQR